MGFFILLKKNKNPTLQKNLKITKIQLLIIETKHKEFKLLYFKSPEVVCKELLNMENQQIIHL